MLQFTQISWSKFWRNFYNQFFLFGLSLNKITSNWQGWQNGTFYLVETNLFRKKNLSSKNVSSCYVSRNFFRITVQINIYMIGCIFFCLSFKFQGNSKSWKIYKCRVFPDLKWWWRLWNLLNLPKSLDPNPRPLKLLKSPVLTKRNQLQRRRYRFNIRFKLRNPFISFSHIKSVFNRRSMNFNRFSVMNRKKLIVKNRAN